MEAGKTLDGRVLTKKSITFEEFEKLCSHDQWQHVDLDKAPSFAKWLKITRTLARKEDSGRYSYSRDHEARLDRRLEEGSGMSLIGSTMAHDDGKHSKRWEYAKAVCAELGLHPQVNQGKFKGTDFDAQELYDLLPEGGEEI